MNGLIIEKFFSAADSLNPDVFMRRLAPDPTWRFGNSPTVHGREAVYEAYKALCDYVVEMEHTIIAHWPNADCSTVESRVRYVDRYGRTFAFPGSTLLFFDGDFAREVRIFADINAMFIPPD